MMVMRLTQSSSVFRLYTPRPLDNAVSYNSPLSVLLLLLYTHASFVQTIQHVQLLQSLCAKVVDGLAVVVNLHASADLSALLSDRVHNLLPSVLPHNVLQQAWSQCPRQKLDWVQAQQATTHEMTSIPVS